MSRYDRQAPPHRAAARNVPSGPRWNKKIGDRYKFAPGWDVSDGDDMDLTVHEHPALAERDSQLTRFAEALPRIPPPVPRPVVRPASPALKRSSGAQSNQLGLSERAGQNNAAQDFSYRGADKLPMRLDGFAEEGSSSSSSTHRPSQRQNAFAQPFVPQEMRPEIGSSSGRRPSQQNGHSWPPENQRAPPAPQETRPEISSFSQVNFETVAAQRFASEHKPSPPTNRRFSDQQLQQIQTHVQHSPSQPDLPGLNNAPAQAFGQQPTAASFSQVRLEEVTSNLTTSATVRQVEVTSTSNPFALLIPFLSKMNEAKTVTPAPAPFYQPPDDMPTFMITPPTPVLEPATIAPQIAKPLLFPDDQNKRDVSPDRSTRKSTFKDYVDPEVPTIHSRFKKSQRNETHETEYPEVEETDVPPRYDPVAEYGPPIGTTATAEPAQQDSEQGNGSEKSYKLHRKSIVTGGVSVWGVTNSDDTAQPPGLSVENALVGFAKLPDPDDPEARGKLVGVVDLGFPLGQNPEFYEADNPKLFARMVSLFGVWLLVLTLIAVVAHLPQ